MTNAEKLLCTAIGGTIAVALVDLIFRKVEEKQRESEERAVRDSCNEIIDAVAVDIREDIANTANTASRLGE